MQTGNRRAVGALLAVVMLVNTGCYSFVPAAQGVAPKPGDLVRIHLNAEGTTELARFLGPRVEYAEGTLNEVRGDGAVVVGVGSVRLLDGNDHFWSGQSVVTFERRFVGEMNVRSIDRQKTRVAVIATSIAVLGIFAIALGTAGAHGNTPGGGEQPPP